MGRSARNPATHQHQFWRENVNQRADPYAKSAPITGPHRLGFRITIRGQSCQFGWISLRQPTHRQDAGELFETAAIAAVAGWPLGIETDQPRLGRGPIVSRE